MMRAGVNVSERNVKERGGREKGERINRMGD